MHIYPAMLVQASNKEEALEKAQQCVDTLLEDDTCYDYGDLVTAETEDEPAVMTPEHPKFHEIIKGRMETEVKELSTGLPYAKIIADLKSGEEILKNLHTRFPVKHVMGIGFDLPKVKSGTEINMDTDLQMAFWHVKKTGKLLEHISNRSSGYITACIDALLYDFRTEGNGEVPCPILEIPAKAPVALLYADFHY